MESHAQEVIDAVSSIRLTAVSLEYDIHGLIEQRLKNAGIEFVHEAKLGRGKRVDFLCGATAVEVKKGTPSPAVLLKQVSGYLSSDDVSDIVIVTKGRVKLPAAIGGKRVFMISLDRLWGISLP